MLRQTHLKHRLHYNKKTGIFKWNNLNPYANSIKSGCVAGWKHDKYISISIDGKGYLAHRLAWLWVYGYLPENPIDHINRNGSDNRITNLREASHSCNMRNIGTRKDNKSGIRGVQYHKPLKKWIPRITVLGKKYHLGVFENLTEAVAHRLAAEQCLDWPGCDFSSPAYYYIQEYLRKNQCQK